MQVLSNVSGRALHVWRRDFDVYLTTWKTNFLPPLLEPVFYVLAFGLGLGSLIGSLTYQGRPVGYLEFMAPGVVAVAIMFWAFFETTYSSFVRMYFQKTFDAIIATPLLVEDVIVGELLWGMTKSVLASSIMIVILSLFGLVSYPSALVVLPLAFLGGLLFAALGLITTALVPSIDTFNLPIFLFVFPMFMFSGTFFPIDILPLWARAIAWVLPLTHVSFLVRGAFLGWPVPQALGHVAYLVALTAAAFVLALVLMKRRLVK
ncbi:MAG: ABC transporter permease [Candidatus Eisenbacteria bacterium]|nr:ABC transporter permease [Candidatus Eisenbacteria bacterium]